MIEFNSLWFFALLPLPLIVYHWLPTANANGSGLNLPHSHEFLVQSKVKVSPSALPLPLWCLLLSWILLVTAGAQPQWLGEPIKHIESSRDLLLVVDTSDSMKKPDMQVGRQRMSRLNAVKLVLNGFIEKRTTDRLGLVIFADRAYLHAPLTFDHDTVKQFLNETQLGFAGTYTAIGDAIALSIKKLNAMDDTTKDKVIILLTDGKNTAGEVSLEQASQLALKSQVKVYTVGIGANQFFGFRQEIDEEALTMIANTTNGQYLRATDVESLTAIYNQIDQLEAIDRERQLVRPTIDLFYWPLALSLLFLWLSSLGSLRFRPS